MRSILQIAFPSKNGRSLEAVGLNVEQRSHFPSFEEGWPRRSRKCNATSDSARLGEVRPLLHKGSDLPRCALFKVAIRFA